MIPFPLYDPVDDEEMEEAAYQGDGPPRVQILADMRRRAEIRFRMELGDRLCRLMVDDGFCPVTIIEIQADRTLIELQRDMPCDMMSLMHHIVRDFRLLVARGYMHHGDARHKNTSNDHDHKGSDHSITPPLPL